MKRAVEFVGYQLTWFVAVIGAGRGLWWAGVLAAAVLAAWQLGTSAHRVATASLALAGIAMGLLIDGGLAATGLLAYAASGPEGWPGAAPWILALWAVFSMSLHCSFDALQRRPLLAAALGAVGGPLAYLGAARGWEAVAFDAPAWRALLVLSMGWALAMPALARLARATAAPRLRAATAGRPA